MTEYVCIDIGGTALKYGLADAAGVFSDKRTVPSELQEKGATALVEKVIGIVRDYQAGHAIQGVAISTAGIVDPEQGSIIYAMPHFPGYTGTPLARLISEAAGVFCTVENDVNCAGLGELWQGAGQGVDSLCCMTVGTGIGGCVLLQESSCMEPPIVPVRWGICASDSRARWKIWPPPASWSAR